MDNKIRVTLDKHVELFARGYLCLIQIICPEVELFTNPSAGTGRTQEGLVCENKK